MSLPYCVAAAIVDNRLGMDQFRRDRLQDQRIREFMDKIKIVADSEFDRFFPEMYPTRVEIVTRDGRVFSAMEHYPKGFSKNPMSEKELEDKFDHLCSYAFEKSRIDELKRMIRQMESLKNTFGLIRLLAGEGRFLERTKDEKKA